MTNRTKIKSFREGRDEGYSYPLLSAEELEARRKHVAGAFEFFAWNLPGAKLSRDYYQPNIIKFKVLDPWGVEIEFSYYEETLADWRGLEDPFFYILERVAETIARRGLSRLFGCEPGEVMTQIRRRFPDYQEASRQWAGAVEASRPQAEQALGLRRS